MAQCEGTTRSGERCKLDSGRGSRFCHLHRGGEGEGAKAEGGCAGDAAEWGDLVPLLVAGAVAAGLLFFLRSFGRWIPRI